MQVDVRAEPTVVGSGHSVNPRDWSHVITPEGKLPCQPGAQLPKLNIGITGSLAAAKGLACIPCTLDLVSFLLLPCLKTTESLTLLCG